MRITSGREWRSSGRLEAVLGAMLVTGCAGDGTGQPWDGMDGGSDGTSTPTMGTSTTPSDGSGGSPSGDATSDPPDGSGETHGTGELPEQPLVDVDHEREFRGVWIATVSNINYPSAQGLSADAQQQELRGLLDVMEDHHLNAIVFQIRPESDALYASELEPWSRFLTGTQGNDPGFDPLAYLIEQAHPRNIEVHAWLNPYRAKVNLGSSLAPGHIALEQAGYAYTYNNFLWMDPGAEPVQERTIDVILDVVDRYDVDGIHFDDYFYPYPSEPERSPHLKRISLVL